MNTPICDFVRQYAQTDNLRLHMPGHKGKVLLGFEPLDLTEVAGADSLYEADGIIRESEGNAGALFGARTFYSTEGSSLCIRAMLYLVALYAGKPGKRTLIAAGRNAHKTFLSGAALLDLEVLWLQPEAPESYLSCPIDGPTLDKTLTEAAEKPAAVYLTSPDYLGNRVDLAAISAVCRRHGVLLLVDNAHGAYLKFLQPSQHPMDLGADLCCDSAHKTLPVVTGGAYLHVSRNAPAMFAQQAKHALALFGSTSPSYLILQSLDAANGYLADGYTEKLEAFTAQVRQLKETLLAHGYTLLGDEPLKLTLSTKLWGYEGEGLAELLAEKGLVCEFCDRDFVVLMVTPETGAEGLSRLKEALLSIPRREPVTMPPPAFAPAQPVLTLRQAMLSPAEQVPVARCAGRILAAASVGCPPAVPIVICGERMEEKHLRAFAYYGIETCTVVKEA